MHREGYKLGGIFIEACIKGREGIEKIEIEEALLYEIAALDSIILENSIEVIKALAVLKRSQMVKGIKNSKYAHPLKDSIVIDRTRYDLLDEGQKNHIREMVAATKGIVAVNGSKAVDFFITECCGGGTSNSEDVLGYRINYLRRVLCEYCSPGSSSKNISIGEYAGKLNLKGLSFKENMDGIFSEAERDDTGRIRSINFLDIRLSGEEFARLFGMDSNRIYFMEDSITLKAIGRGMGLGICLEGADKMAKEGHGFMEIINYYYTGVEFENLDEYKLQKTLGDKKIIIDPGHGGVDMGNTSDGIVEKEVNLQIALKLKDRLEERGALVILTRCKDVNLPLSDRVDMINKERPELFISIHQNHFASPGVNGVECYCYKRDEEALRLGSIITKKISERTGIKDRGIRTGDYYLLRECKVSGIMVECMYLSGRLDREKYNQENYGLIADAMYESLCAYYSIEP